MESVKKEDASTDRKSAGAFELWEKVDTYIIKSIPEPYMLKDVVPEAPVEIEMNQKNFLVLTEFTVESNRCV